MPAKKYTEKFVLNELKSMYQELLNNDQIYLINHLFISRRYSRSRYHEWRNTFANNDEIRELFERVENILEGRIANGALVGRLNPTMSIFVLKNKYGWLKDGENKSDEGKGFILEIRGYTPPEDNGNSLEEV